MFTPILLYHSISDQSSKEFSPHSISPRLFEEHIAYLSDAGYHSYTVTEYASLAREDMCNFPSKAVVITFDDGYADFYHVAAPILDHYGMKATVYISTRYVGSTSLWLGTVGEGTHPMMTWRQIEEIYDAGVECGAHAHQHLQLDILPAWKVWQEIFHCKEVVEDHLNQPIFSFAYPHGYYSSSIKEMVQQAGFSSACAERNPASSNEGDLFALARLPIDANSYLPVFRLLLEGQGLELTPYREGIRAKAGRGARWLSDRLNHKLGL